MKSSSLFSFASFLVVGVVAGCSSADPGASSDVDGTSPTGTTPDGFCAKKCIPEDRDKCVAFAGRFSDAFLAAFDACGDNPGCLQPKLDAAPKTERQEKLASDFCAKCGCSTPFYAEGGAGASIQSFSDARLDGVEEKCFPELKEGLTCELTFATCVIPLLEEDLGATLICRQRRR
jgi:hypothetical protein